MWCDACRSTGAIHCAMPDECGNMLSATAAADNWKAWLDDLPLPFTFDPAIGRLQDFITGLTARIEAQAGARTDAKAAQALVVERFRHDLQFMVDSIAEDKAYVADKYPALFKTIQARRAEMGTLGGVQVFGEIARDLLVLAPADGLAAVDALRAEIADLKMNMDADLRTMVREGQQLRTLAAELAAAQQREAALTKALEACVASLERVDTAEGVCCCGDSMDRHSDPMSCGHSPVDMGDYYAGQALESARAALAQTPTDPGDGWTWNERLGWIGPDGKPAARGGA